MIKSSKARQIHWQQVYQRDHRQVSWYQSVPSRSLALIRQLGLSLDAPMLDAGAGASTLVDHLLQDGFTNVTCLDLAPQALSISKRRLAGSASRVRWVTGDVLSSRFPTPFTLWHDRAVFHFLTSAKEQRQYVRLLNTSVVDSGYVILATFTDQGPQRCSGLSVQQHNSVSISRLFGEHFTLLKHETEQHLTPSDTAQAFCYFLLQKKAN